MTDRDFAEGDVVLHLDGDLGETVVSVEPMLSAVGVVVTYLRTARRFRPACEFTFTGLHVPR